MYKQENKAGVKEFVKIIAATVAAMIASGFLGGLINYISKDKINAALSGQIVLIALAVVLVWLVYHHYASSFKYKINKKHIVIEKKTGSRITEYEIPLSEIEKVYIRTGVSRLKGKKLRLSKSFFINKRSTVLIVGAEENIVVFEPDDEFIGKLKEYMND